MVQDSGQAHIGKLVGARLREARQAKHMTQGQLAQDDFSVSYISAIERGQIHPSLRAMEIFAHRLGLSSKDLLLSPPKVSGPVGLVTMSGEDQVDVQILNAEVMLHLKATERAIPVLEELASKRSLSSAQKSRALYLLGKAHLQLNDLQVSEHFFAEAARQLKDTDSLLAIRILNAQGIVHTLMHHHSQGMALFQTCREKLEAHPGLDMYLTAEVYTHLGQHYLELERDEDALALFQSALQQTQASDPVQQIERYTQALQESISAGEHSHATLTAHKLLYLLDRSKSQALYRELYHQLGRALLESNSEQARAHLEETLRQTQDTLVQASAHIHLATWNLAQHKVAEAKKHAQKAKAMLESGGSSMIAADAAIISGKIEYAQKHYEAGDTFFEQGLSMLEQLDAREELADQSAEYAQLLENRGDMHRAVAYWKKAFERRQRYRR